MKAKLLFLFLFVSFISCSEHENLTETYFPATVGEESNVRSFSEALQIAQDAIALLDDRPVTRSDFPRRISLSDSKVFCGSTTRLDNDNDTLMYIFNFEGNQGFAIISGTKDAEPLLAITEQGNYDPHVPTGIEGFDCFMNAAGRYVRQMMDSSVLRAPQPSQKDSLIRIEYPSVGPLLSVRWGQVHPEGEYFYNGIAGCTNTALAQIMSYYEYPSTINISFPGADTSSQYLSWSSIKAHQTGHDVSQCSNVAIHKAIGRMVRQLGWLNLSLDSIPGSTPTFSEISVIPTMQALGYSTGNSFQSYSWDAMTNYLDNQKLVLFQGHDNSHYSSHNWVADGYSEVIHVYAHYIFMQQIGQPAYWHFTGYRYVHSGQLCHFNWGWYGDCNGYFAKDVFATQDENLYDINVTSTHDYNFSANVKILPIWH